MGIDRHEWEHRNYRPGRKAPAFPRESNDPLPDALLGPDVAPLQPEMPVDPATNEQTERQKSEQQEAAKPASKTTGKDSAGKDNAKRQIGP